MAGIIESILGIFKKKPLPLYMTLKPDSYMEPRAPYAPNSAYQKHYIVYDFETTGIDPHQCEIVEIGAIKVDDGEIIDRFQTFIKPFNPIPAEATKVNHITNAMVKDAPTAEEVFTSFIDFIGDSKLVGYNIVGFDHIILRRYAMAICGKLLNNYVTDVYQLFRRTVKIPKNTLSDAAHYFDIDITDAHRSIGDCETTFKCFCELQKVLKANRAKKNET